MIDLRSDTATRPTEGMRRALAAAEVGDEQRREDPTVAELEERAAALLGHEASVYLPTATMANQIALRAHSQPGDEVVAEADAHVFRAELGGPAVHSGLAMKAIRGERGLFAPGDVRDAVNPPDVHMPPTRILCLENTHNGGGGKVWPPGLLREVAAEARRHGLAVHLDGARLLNAAVASGTGAADYGREADTVTLCLSKGLGCPLGALLAGGTELIGRARRLKHLFGGAMRQAGIVAAAGLYALDYHVERLAEDHANARGLAEGLAAAGLPVDPAEVETNFVLLDAAALGLTVQEAAARLRVEGVLLSPAIRRGCLRAVTHLDVTAADVERAIAGAAWALARGR
ncbi:MAG: aminotransferase class I/II-fold pyridoxal phosphate-dependent enzyme [Thermoleophilia bacterium]|nr:aminotransferase class I/II-fold pyridoxal phosphate-dependent enzyme [Thermoleophilia bacterium]